MHTKVHNMYAVHSKNKSDVYIIDNVYRDLHTNTKELQESLTITILHTMKKNKKPIITAGLHLEFMLYLPDLLLATVE